MAERFDTEVWFLLIMTSLVSFNYDLIVCICVINKRFSIQHPERSMLKDFGYTNKLEKNYEKLTP